MATNQEVQELILRVTGRDEVERIKKAVDEEAASFQKLVSTLGDVDRAQVAADKGVQLAADNLLALERQLAEAQTRQRNFGLAALEASRALEDLQYGIGGVLNNLPGLIAALGGPAGVAAAVSVLAVGAVQLVKHWDELRRIFADTPPDVGKAITSLTALQDRIKELSDKKTKIGVEYDELERAKHEAQGLTEALKTAEDVRAGQARAERESGVAIREAIAEAPGGGAAVVGALAGPRQAEIEAESRAAAARRQAEIEAETTRARETELPGAPIFKQLERRAAESRARLERELNGAAKEAEIEIGRLIDTATKGTGTAQEQAQDALRRGLAAAGQGALAGRIGGLGPMQIQGQQVQEEVAKQAELRDREVRRAAEAADRQTEALNRQGEQGERRQREASEREAAAEDRAVEARRAAAERGPIGGGVGGGVGGRRGGGGGGVGGGGVGGGGVGGGGGVEVGGGEGGGGGEVIGVPAVPEPVTVEARIARARERRADQQRAREERRDALRRRREERRRARPLPRALEVERQAGVSGTFAGPSEGAGMRLPTGIRGPREAIAAAQTAALSAHAQGNGQLLQAQAMGLQVVRALAAELEQTKLMVAHLVNGYRDIGQRTQAHSRSASFGRNGGR